MKLRRVLFIALISIIAMAFLYVVIRTTSHAKIMASRPVMPEGTIVNFELYNRIVKGMTYSEVFNLIGYYGTEISREVDPGLYWYTPDVTEIIYAWNNTDGSGMLGVFRNRRLISKNQIRLQ